MWRFLGWDVWDGFGRGCGIRFLGFLLFIDIGFVLVCLVPLLWLVQWWILHFRFPLRFLLSFLLLPLFLFLLLFFRNLRVLRNDVPLVVFIPRLPRFDPIEPSNDEALPIATTHGLVDEIVWRVDLFLALRAKNGFLIGLHLFIIKRSIGMIAIKHTYRKIGFIGFN